jgi:hypothetical protein
MHHIILIPALDLPDRGGTALQKEINHEGVLNMEPHAKAVDPWLQLAIVTTLRSMGPHTVDIENAMLFVEQLQYSISVFIDDPRLHAAIIASEAMKTGLLLRGTYWNIELPTVDHIPQSDWRNVIDSLPPWTNTRPEHWDLRRRGKRTRPVPPREDQENEHLGDVESHSSRVSSTMGGPPRPRIGPW